MHVPAPPGPPCELEIPRFQIPIPAPRAPCELEITRFQIPIPAPSAPCNLEIPKFQIPIPAPCPAPSRPVERSFANSKFPNSKFGFARDCCISVSQSVISRSRPALTPPPARSPAVRHSRLYMLYIGCSLRRPIITSSARPLPWNPEPMAPGTLASRFEGPASRSGPSRTG